VILTADSDIRALLERTRTIFMVGASANPVRPSYFVFRYLSTHGFEVHPVNPAYADIEGVKCYKTLAECAVDNGSPDVVDVFRKAEEVVPVARESIEIGARARWFQYGVVNQDAIRLADEAGLTVVVDRCMKVEHARIAGGLTAAGMNSRVITSKRRSL
jgi:predicted CoA-binding protein